MVREDGVGGCCRDPGKKRHCPELYMAVGMETDIFETPVGGSQGWCPGTVDNVRHQEGYRVGAQVSWE